MKGRGRPDATTIRSWQAERDIEELRAEYVDLYDYAPVGYVTFDDSGLILDANRTAARLLGFERKDLLGGDFTLFVEDESREEFNIHLLRVLNSEEMDICEIVVKRKDQTTAHLRIESLQTRFAGRMAARTVITDISERKKAEKEKDELIRQLKNALSEIKTLRGLLPICASCKKVRTPDGLWEQVEVYVRDRSEAQFSHTYCPECVKKLYPGKAALLRCQGGCVK